MSKDGAVATISSRGVLVEVAYLRGRMTRGEYSAYLDSLTIRWQPKIGREKVTRMYEKVRDGASRECLLLPRGELARLSVPFYSRMGPLRVAKYMPGISGSLRQSQQVVLDYILERFTVANISAGRACLYLEIKPGFGKTFVGAALASRLGLRTAYVVPRRKLATQGLADAASLLAGDEPAIGCQEGKFAKKISSVPAARQAITFYVINSFLKIPEKELQQYSLVILDEAHMYHSDSRRAVFKMCRHAVLGLTATPASREDGADQLVDRELGGVVHALDIPGFSYEAATIFRGVVRVIKYYGPDEYTQNLTHASTDKLFVHYMYEQFAADPYRNRLAVEELRALLDWVGPAGQRHCVFAFAEEKNNLAVIRDALLDSYGAEAANVPGLYADAEMLDEDTVGILDEGDAGMFVGGVTDDKIKTMTETCRIFFATYPFAGTGVSIPRVSAMVFLTPRKANMDQIFGRMLRTGGDTSIVRVAVDIVDARTALIGQYRVRSATYRANGFDIQRIHKKYEELQWR